MTGVQRDRSLLRRLASGDVAALEQIYDAHADRLYRIALHVTRNRSDAEDVVQGVMVKLASMGPDLLVVRQPAGYLARMARLRALDVVAGRKESIDASTPEPAEAPPRDAELSVLERHLEALRPDQREALRLRAAEGMSFREIGQATGVSTFTAASRYRLAVARLRRALSGARTS
ncbi:MAG: sigma-70 family RNA polymerase sigma factor [Acidobacteriota bacterium]